MTNLDALDNAIATIEDARYDPAALGITDVIELSDFLGQTLRGLRGEGLQPFLEVKAEVERENDWTPNRLHGPIRQMQEAGYSEGKIIHEMLSLMAAALARFRAQFPD